MIMDLGPDDVGYVCMPLFHSNAVQVGWAPSIVYGASVGLARKFSRVGLAARRPPLRRDLLQLHRQAAGLPARAARAARRRRQPAAGRVRQRGLAPGGRRVRPALRRRGHRRVRRDRGRRRGEPRRRGARRRARAWCGGGVKVVDDDGTEKPRARFDADGRLVERGRVRRRDRQHRGRRPVRGLLQQPRGDREDDPLRLVLVRRPRLPRRGRLPLLRRPHRGLDPGRRRELPGRADRGRAASATPTSCSSAVYGVPDESAGDQVMARLVLRDGADVRPGRVRDVGRRPGRRRAEVAAALRARRCATRRPPAPTRS